jgi:cytochrome b6-f complex iron-sulfur subunit
MAEKTSDLSGDDRAARIAELKRKMQESAKKTKAAPTERSAEQPAAATPVAAEPAPAAHAETVAVADPAATSIPASQPAASASPRATNGTAAPRPALAPRPAPQSAVVEESAGPTPAESEMNRREFLTYAWGAALGLLALEAGVVSFMFMYPRFRAGEFGGQFFLDASEVPAVGQAPAPNTAGKFWLASSEEGDPLAIYMVCTHLGCLYKWEPSTFRFECPCHGSKFTALGHYIEGPAPRSLDLFVITVDESGQIVVDTGRRVTGAPATESPARHINS